MLKNDGWKTTVYIYIFKYYSVFNVQNWEKLAYFICLYIYI